MASGHRTAERRSLEFHRLVAERLDDRLVEGARRRVDQWLANGGPVHPFWAQRWRELLEQPLPDIAQMLTADGEEAQDLRQNTPFAGALTPQERWRIVREVR
jgi:hypothetical protein